MYGEKKRRKERTRKNNKRQHRSACDPNPRAKKQLWRDEVRMALIDEGRRSERFREGLNSRKEERQDCKEVVPLVRSNEINWIGRQGKDSFLRQ